MFNNLLSIDDLWRVAEKLKQGDGPEIARRLLSVTATKRAESAWRHTEYPLKTWGSLPAVQRRWNLLATSEAETTIHEYVAATYLSEGGNAHALSIGCGTGAHEMRWARTGRFGTIEAIDISSERISQAIRNATESKAGDIISFRVADAREVEATRPRFDAILAINALHHISPLAVSIRNLRDALKPDGLLILWDYVGPARFQWTERQVAIVDDLLHQLPNNLRLRWRTNSLKKRQWRPSRLSMMFSDPSEAAESNSILPILERHFELLEKRDLGGTVLHLLLDDIAHNFDPPTPESSRWLQWLFDAEDRLIATKEIPSDFVFAVFRKAGTSNSEHRTRSM